MKTRASRTRTTCKSVFETKNVFEAISGFVNWKGLTWRDGTALLIASVRDTDAAARSGLQLVRQKVYYGMIALTHPRCYPGWGACCIALSITSEFLICETQSCLSTKEMP